MEDPQRLDLKNGRGFRTVEKTGRVEGMDLTTGVKEEVWREQSPEQRSPVGERVHTLLGHKDVDKKTFSKV